MRELYRIVIESANARTGTSAFESAQEAAEYLLGMIAEYGEEIESATIEKYFGY